MVPADKIVHYLNRYLEIDRIKDYGPNGLQVSGKNEVGKIVLGVSASLELFQEAVKRNADTIIVHHGLFWETGRGRIDKVMKERLKILFDNDITLLAYHLPLDKHPKVGNNTQILKRLELKFIKQFGEHDKQYIGAIGELKNAVTFEEFVKRIDKVLDTNSLAFNYGPKVVKTVGIVSGGGGGWIVEAAGENVDVFVTGEPKEFAQHFAKDGKVNMIVAGHYKTERFGIQALGELLKRKFNVKTEFIDVGCDI